MLATYANTTKKAKLEIIGHSLGGTDAQRTLINLVDPENDFHFSEIALFSYSSPKLDLEKGRTPAKTVDKLVAHFPVLR